MSVIIARNEVAAVLCFHRHLILFTRGGVSVPACTTGHMTGGGFSVQEGSLSRGGLC